MKTIGLIGGMSWESTVTYYQLINEAVKTRLGGFHSAKILLYSVDFAEIEGAMAAGDWDGCARMLSAIAVKLEQAGAGFLLICTNTLHKVAPQVQGSVSVPVIHIAGAVAEAMKARGLSKAALLGTRYTMTQDFIRSKLEDAGIEVLLPAPPDIGTVNRVIFDELCMGIVSEASRKEYLRIMEGLAAKGAQGVVLGCTEIGMLIRQEDTALPVFDTTRIHAAKAVSLAFS